ncbi:MAG: Imm7 family immunity protein [Deltaproteobacteria bacterium]
MVELHGWFVLEEDPDGDELPMTYWDGVRRRVEAVGDNPRGELRVINGSFRALFDGTSNHHNSGVEAVVSVAEWLASSLPRSYGLLHIWDDEDRGDDGNRFVVYVMKRGRLERRNDEFLSPIIPTVFDD